MALMRAKLRVGSCFPTLNANGEKVAEQVTFHGVAKSNYSSDGSDEDNSFAKWSPSISLVMTVANPALFGKLIPGAAFYVDFTPVEAT